MSGGPKLGLAKVFHDQFDFTSGVTLSPGRRVESPELFFQLPVIVDPIVQVAHGPFLCFGFGEVEHGELGFAVASEFERLPVGQRLGCHYIVNYFF